jgi:hypothetical protein
MSLDLVARGSSPRPLPSRTEPAVFTGPVTRAVPDRRTRFFRALMAVGLWGLTALPTLLGTQRCTIAKVFHRPCPGCGMTRAVDLLLAGQWRASLQMHPLAVPMLVAGGVFAASTIWTTYQCGWPLVHKSALGKTALALLALTYLASIALWVFRSFGYFGGPVPV